MEGWKGQAGLLGFLGRQGRCRRRVRVMGEGERNWACLMEKAWCMTDQAMLFVSHSLLSRIVDRFPTSHDDVEGQLQLTRPAAPRRKGREARTAWWAVFTG